MVGICVRCSAPRAELTPLRRKKKKLKKKDNKTDDYCGSGHCWLGGGGENSGIRKRTERLAVRGSLLISPRSAVGLGHSRE